VLGASIITRNRELPLALLCLGDFVSDEAVGNAAIRWLAPPVFLAASASYFLPKTTDNIRNIAFSIEEAWFPGLAAYHRRAYESASSAWRSASESTSSTFKGSVDGWTKKIEGLTGLKVHEATRTKPGSEKE
jgi:hypothetical protein